MLGGTGTGKSTLMLNMIAQDMKAGRAVILIDPHGDLWEKALKLVPNKRQKDLVLVHPTDARGHFTMNILERLGDDVDGEHGRIIDELLDFFKRSMWKEVPEAFGPMFTNYFRNGLQLLLNAEGDNASILDFPRLFSDDAYRAKLLAKCRNPDVPPVLARHCRWSSVRGEAVQSRALHRLQDEPDHRQRPSEANPRRQPLDARFRQGHRGAEDLSHQSRSAVSGERGLRFLGGMITARLVASAKVTQASVADEQRKRVNVYMDEFQTYISAGLADGLAEVRKYGLNLVLANQSLSQLQGDRYQAEVAEAVMSNAANVIAFRVGIADAARLGRRFEPELAAANLAKLPNYHAAGIIVRGSAVSAPEIFATLPEPKPRRKGPAKPHAAGRPYSQVPARASSGSLASAVSICGRRCEHHGPAGPNISARGNLMPGGLSASTLADDARLHNRAASAPVVGHGATLRVDDQVVVHTRDLEVTLDLVVVSMRTVDGDRTSTTTIGFGISRLSNAGSGNGAAGASGTKALCLVIRTVGPSGPT